MVESGRLPGRIGEWTTVLSSVWNQGPALCAAQASRGAVTSCALACQAQGLWRVGARLVRRGMYSRRAQSWWRPS